MSDYTPEPWMFYYNPNDNDQNPDNFYLQSVDMDADNDGRPAEDNETFLEGSLVLEDDEKNLANARRICACVNACQGISTEALESGVIGGMVEALRGCADAIALLNDTRPENLPGMVKALANVLNAEEQAKAVLARLEE